MKSTLPRLDDFPVTNGVLNRFVLIISLLATETKNPVPHAATILQFPVGLICFVASAFSNRCFVPSYAGFLTADTHHLWDNWVFSEVWSLREASERKKEKEKSERWDVGGLSENGRHVLQGVALL